jgi:hypothetical protein
MGMRRKRFHRVCVGLIAFVCVVGISIGAATGKADCVPSSDIQADWAPAGTAHWDMVHEINGPPQADYVYTSTPGAVDWYGFGDAGEPTGDTDVLWTVCAAHILARKTGTGNATVTVEVYLGSRQAWFPVKSMVVNNTSWHGFILPWNGEYTLDDLNGGLQLRMTYTGPSTATVQVDEVRITFGS